MAEPPWAHLNAGESCCPGQSSPAALPERPRTACLSCCKNNGAGNLGQLGEGPSPRHLPQPAPTPEPRTPPRAACSGPEGLGAAHSSGRCDDPSHALEPSPTPEPRPLLPASCLPAHHVAEVPGLQPKSFCPDFKSAASQDRRLPAWELQSLSHGEGPLWALERPHARALSGWDPWACEALPPP